MSFYLGPYAIVNPFEEISGSLKKTCPQGHSHVVNYNLNFNQINFCSRCGEKLITTDTTKNNLIETNHFNLKHYKKIDLNSDKFDCLELNNKKTIWKIKNNKFSLFVEENNQGSQEISNDLREKSIIYFNQVFNGYENFFEENNILFVVDFGFISEI